MVGELLGRLFFAENMAGKNKPMTFNGIKTNYFNIDVGQYSTPQIFDLDKDGKQDLIIGERDGTLNFFKNKFLNLFKTNLFHLNFSNFVANLSKSHNEYSQNQGQDVQNVYPGNRDFKAGKGLKDAVA
jgi:hypothetical protein